MESKKLVSKMQYNHSDVRRTVNELKQQGLLIFMDPVETIGNHEGWQCQPFMVKCMLNELVVQRHENFHYQPDPVSWYTTKKKAISAAYTSVLQYFGLEEYLPEETGSGSAKCENCAKLERQIKALENELGWR